MAFGLDRNSERVETAVQKTMSEILNAAEDNETKRPKIDNVKSLKESEERKVIENNNTLDRFACVVDAVMTVERQKGRNNLTRHGAYVIKAAELLLQELYNHDHIVIQEPYMAGKKGSGFKETNDITETNEV